MGSAIAYLIASKTDARVTLYDSFSQSIEKSKATVEKYVNTSVEKGFLTADKAEQVKKNVVWTQSLDDAADADLVIEAIAEDLNMKHELFKKLDQLCKPDTIFASNTSSLPITTLASVTHRTNRFLGMHFFSPAHMMKLLELIPGIDTDPSVLEQVKEYGRSIGKTVICSKDMPGFITTRLGMVLLNEAAFALMEGMSTAEEIDTGMVLGYNHPMGPLALADFVGLDICLHVMETLYEGFGDPKYRPCPLLRQLVTAGHIGKKSGRGFYKYEQKQLAACGTKRA